MIGGARGWYGGCGLEGGKWKVACEGLDRERDRLEDVAEVGVFRNAELDSGVSARVNLELVANGGRVIKIEKGESQVHLSE